MNHNHLNEYIIKKITILKRLKIMNFKNLTVFLCCLFLTAACTDNVALLEPEVIPPVTVPPLLDTAIVNVLSNRADLISAGDVLVEVIVKEEKAISGLILTLNTENVTSVLMPSGDNPLRLLGLIEGLVIGENLISVNIGNSITVTNHPAGGPLFTGPHIQPWACQDSAKDDECNQPVEYQFLYRSTDPNSVEFKDYDPASPADDVAMTTTDNGETIPFIVRRERGYQGRDQYYIFTLHKPTEAWTAASPQSQWNKRLLVTHGGNCRGDHDTDRPKTADFAGTIPENPAVPNSYVTALGLGWSVFSAAQLNLGHNCNVSYQAEALMMGKERFVEQYGELRYTVGTGCSGGAITQNMIANAYPGLYNGLLTTCTYPDVLSTATQFADYHILLNYFEFRADTPDTPEDFDGFMQTLTDLGNTVAGSSTARDGTAFTVTQQNAIYGHKNGVLNASLADSALFKDAVNPQSSCGGISDEQRYHPTDNPSGARCDVMTFMKNIVGPRDRFDALGNERWSANEIQLQEGFAGLPLGNQGVQYGLLPFKEGIISPAQFVALNTNIGAIDSDLNLTTERLQPDFPALPRAFRSGIANTIVNMDTVPIINMTGPGPGIAHDSVHGYWVRYRFEREFGHRDNFVMWGGPTPLIGDINFMTQSLAAMTLWLDAIETDTSETSLAQKILINKPTEIGDRCLVADLPTNQMCPEETMLVYGTPRTEAGDDKYGDQLQCQLRPFSRSEDYGPAGALFTDDQWLALEEAFKVNGEPMVCDWSKRPLAWQPTVTWLDYQDQLGDMVYGGEQLAPAPYPSGWASKAFNKAWQPGWQAK
jgi:hypothetical protein